ncbi:uncharacterized protein LOC131095702 [Melospiza georgiana]|uniref:uncharacterized protein LOC131095702 n=1 Tax=Melospiza georgiana TaxID=44398 RepID=UPI0025AB7662|nr:uncharacterized protein LOC131095702 [Melospiza georgiana]
MPALQSSGTPRGPPCPAAPSLAAPAVPGSGAARAVREHCDLTAAAAAPVRYKSGRAAPAPRQHGPLPPALPREPQPQPQPQPQPAPPLPPPGRAQEAPRLPPLPLPPEPPLQPQTPPPPLSRARGSASPGLCRGAAHANKGLQCPPSPSPLHAALRAIIAHTFPAALRAAIALTSP